ncbi:MAG TPA: carbamoyltransferase HypF, partial [Anaerolineae bacterium]|nr:carbamoyltransferase HypF [Anaerolineae bacterium]
MNGKRIHINGIVQGVGFRPFVYGLAADLALTGWVRNTSAGVDIEVEGTPEQLERFTAALTHDAPPLAQIDEITITDQPANGFTAFEIIHSQPVADAFQPISPDVSICADCLRELFDPNDRRCRYPFINCTNCGPRFTIIKDIPYDRPLTTMAPFEMCPDCRAEYEDPLDRRFHAQPVACPACGPQVWLEFSDQFSVFSDQFSVGDIQSFDQIRTNPSVSSLRAENAIQAARQLLAEGKIVAIKGLGGFHLACDATNETAVTELRRRKLRRDKPFALMLPDLATIEKHCYVNQAERDLLAAPQRPIVILRRRPDSPISTAVAPGQNSIGVMLPYTPLHYLLLEQSPPFNHQAPIFVMTSGNLSEEPIACHNDEARERLAQLTDAFLMHDREIHVRCDDSVMRVFSNQFSVFSEPAPMSNYQLPIRRSRGYAPFPVRLPWKMPPILAVGAELKNTFCLTHGRYAFLSQHIGDLENYETLQSFEEGIAHFERLFRVQPELVAYDLHPDYLATRYALARAEREGLTAVPIQHHHAHIAACMAEHGLPNEPVIGISFDGTGYGTDGRIWGGEILLADYAGFERPYHLAYIPLLGGDTAVRQPWRLALAWLRHAGLDWSGDFPPAQAAPPEALPV